MRILITGGAGFIGSNLADCLATKGHSVTVLDNFSTGKKENLPHDVTVVHGDTTNKNDLKNLVGFDVVFHLAAKVSVPLSIKDPFETISTNVMGTVNILDRFRDADIVFVSSAAVYGETNGKVKEDSPLRPRSPYAASKAMGEVYCNSHAEVYGTKISILRPFNVYGPRQDASNPYAGVIVKMMDLAKRNEPLIIFGDGEQTRDFVHVQDVCRALELALGKGGTYNIGTGVETSINNLASIIIEACCSKSIVTGAPEESGQIKHSVADISKARKELRYEPKIGIKHGIEGLL